MSIKKLIAIAAVTLAATAVEAHGAHPVGNDGFLGGLLHPFIGIDHWLLAIALGIWAGRVMERRWSITSTERGMLVAACLFYGSAHGAVLAAPLHTASFGAGLVVSTLLLIAGGALLHRRLSRRRQERERASIGA